MGLALGGGGVAFVVVERAQPATKSTSVSTSERDVREQREPSGMCVRYAEGRVLGKY